MAKKPNLNSYVVLIKQHIVFMAPLADEGNQSAVYSRKKANELLAMLTFSVSTAGHEPDEISEHDLHRLAMLLRSLGSCVTVTKKITQLSIAIRNFNYD